MKPNFKYVNTLVNSARSPSLSPDLIKAPLSASVEWVITETREGEEWLFREPLLCTFHSGLETPIVVKSYLRALSPLSWVPSCHGS